jgi:hypothetical protein|tara:strand:+ start:10197 stop:11030 length:834 start_codon:yes stop_codon:yes gene_type:complete
MNPLNKYFRQPKIYIKLPTGGKFNPELETTVLDEIGVCSMSAIDEITLKNPESLLNGEAIISIIKSCVPSISDPRKLCNIDVEALFLAIQYATYNKDITHEHTCSKCSEVSEFSIDVNYMLNRFPDIDFIEPIQYEDALIHIRPPTVDNITRMTLIDLEQKRIIQGLSTVDDQSEEMEVAKKFYNSFKKIAEFNVDMLANAISHIEIPDMKVSDQDQISEFLHNIPTTLVDEINEAVGKLVDKPEEATLMKFVCSECGQEDEVQMEMNPANFSKAGS